jgi:hypothetical protein
MGCPMSKRVKAKKMINGSTSHSFRDMLVESAMVKHIKMQINGIENFSSNVYAELYKTAHTAISFVDQFLLASLESDISILKYSPDKYSQLMNPVTNYNIYNYDHDSDKIYEHIVKYLESGRRSIFTHDYKDSEILDNMIKTISELAIMADEEISYKVYCAIIKR